MEVPPVADRGSLVAVAFMTLVAAQLFDFATFLIMVRDRGPETEANPLVATLFAELGSPAVLLAKVLLILLVGALGLAGAAGPDRVSWRLMAAVPIAVAIVAGVVGGISNARVIMA